MEKCNDFPVPSELEVELKQLWRLRKEVEECYSYIKEVRGVDMKGSGIPLVTILRRWDSEREFLEKEISSLRVEVNELRPLREKALAWVFDKIQRSIKW